MKGFIAAICPLLAAGTIAAAAEPQTLQLRGQAGFLSEWELAADVSAQSPGGRAEFSGALAIKHVGICSSHGPEEETGRITLRMLAASRVRATFTFDGRACIYQGALSASHVGAMECAGNGASGAIPISLWLK
ncbi:MAG TPA: hypothetical protein VEK73_18115 [Xanthobacteraceae bacterium]|nr:hypothetical protein [Xanthobacteraceae bacterium]